MPAADVRWTGYEVHRHQVPANRNRSQVVYVVSHPAIPKTGEDNAKHDPIDGGMTPTARYTIGSFLSAFPERHNPYREGETLEGRKEGEQ